MSLEEEKEDLDKSISNFDDFASDAMSIISESDMLSQVSEAN
mgnify:CR=1 FL=1